MPDMQTNIFSEALRKVAEGRREAIGRHLISDQSSVREALAAINRLSGDEMTLFVVDVRGCVVGSLTDGDVRRGLIGGLGLDTPVGAVARTQFRALRPGADRYAVAKEARAKGIALLPELDGEGMLLEMVDLRRVRALLPLDAVLMAGGRGERLRPLTLTTPKPLLKVGPSAIIDHNINALRACGVQDIFVSTNYLREQIEEHFSADALTHCIAEPMRMGTLGSLSLIAPQLTQPDVVVMNSDVLTDLDFEAMYAHHRDSGAALTIAAVQYPVSVPFAILRTEGDRVEGLSEKPTYNYFANAGVYIMRRDIAARVPADTYTDAPDFIASLIEEGLKVSYFPIKGIWIDIGSPDDYRYACELMGTRQLASR